MNFRREFQNIFYIFRIFKSVLKFCSFWWRPFRTCVFYSIYFLCLRSVRLWFVLKIWIGFMQIFRTLEEVGMRSPILLKSMISLVYDLHVVWQLRFFTLEGNGNSRILIFNTKILFSFILHIIQRKHCYFKTSLWSTFSCLKFVLVNLKFSSS